MDPPTKSAFHWRQWIYPQKSWNRPYKHSKKREYFLTHRGFFPTPSYHKVGLKMTRRWNLLSVGAEEFIHRDHGIGSQSIQNTWKCSPEHKWRLFLLIELLSYRFLTKICNVIVPPMKSAFHWRQRIYPQKSWNRPYKHSKKRDMLSRA